MHFKCSILFICLPNILRKHLLLLFQSIFLRSNIAFPLFLNICIDTWRNMFESFVMLKIISWELRLRIKLISPQVPTMYKSFRKGFQPGTRPTLVGIKYQLGCFSNWTVFQHSLWWADLKKIMKEKKKHCIGVVPLSSLTDPFQ